MIRLKHFILPPMPALFLLLLCIGTGCGTTEKVLSSDPATSEEMLHASDGRIARIEMRDNTAEFGSNIVMDPSKTQWVTASIVRREFNEINVFHVSDSWKFTEGSTLHESVSTSMIKSITIPADRVGTGIVIGGLTGAALGAGLIALVNTSTSISGGASSSINTLFILDAVLFALLGAALGGQAGAAHQTVYIR